MSELFENEEEASKVAKDMMESFARDMEWTGVDPNKVIEDIETIAFGNWTIAGIFFIPLIVMTIRSSEARSLVKWVSSAKALEEVADKIKDMQTTIDNLKYALMEGESND